MFQSPHQRFNKGSSCRSYRSILRCRNVECTLRARCMRRLAEAGASPARLAAYTPSMYHENCTARMASSCPKLSHTCSVSCYIDGSIAEPSHFYDAETILHGECKAFHMRQYVNRINFRTDCVGVCNTRPTDKQCFRDRASQSTGVAESANREDPSGLLLVM